MSDSAGIYLHIPFCAKKCGYCDFYSETDARLIPDYVMALEQEIKMRGTKENPVNTLYFGGGTPSLLPVERIACLLAAIHQNFRVDPAAEITFEVNPGTLDKAYLTQVQSLGINRLSIGVQSLDDRKLRFLGRIHSSRQARKIVADARKVGFDNLSIDMIYGLPFETSAGWTRDLDRALDLESSHISAYMLTLEPGTPLGKKAEQGGFRPMDRETLSDLFVQTSRSLDEHGFIHYEISNFAKGEGSRSRHNSSYWAGTPYHGFGAAAHSFDGSNRFWNHPDIKEYVKSVRSGNLPVKETERLTREQQMLEMLMLRLRTIEGLAVDTFDSMFNAKFETDFSDLLNQIRAQKLGEITRNRFCLTLDGRACLDSILESFAGKIL